MYDSTHVDVKKLQWDFLKELSDNVFQPWIVFGDRNVHMSNKVHKASNSSNDNMIRQVIDSAGLMDLGFIGHNYTWSNMSNGRGYKRGRIDLALHNALWKLHYPYSKLYHLSFRASDHCTILLLTEAESHRPFRYWKFYKCWLRDSKCLELINTSSHDLEINSNFTEKLNNTRKVMAKWNREDFGHINKRIKYLKELLSNLKSLPYSNSNSNKIQTVIDHISYWEKIEAEFWQQKAGDNWIKDADNNTAYFHSRANRRRSRNNITALRDSSGRWFHQRKDLVNLLTDHFSSIATTTNPQFQRSSFNFIKQLITPGDNDHLLLECTGHRWVPYGLLLISMGCSG
ncbi:uncharacterized protein LOC113278700 [Papaver somniferum]|uniref:uncharacterized protein LOC113278700 n=1 Tax=Papaver somniferum TaxID=3469 RepID=UPI000E6F7938|nr:uncharacterized protein LOC113278700 [Papaver somniferum]